MAAAKLRTKTRTCPMCSGAGGLTEPADGALRALRVAAGMTLAHVKELTGYSLTYLSDMERGRRPATQAVIDVYEKLGAPAKPKKAAHNPAEIAWRVEECWRVHLVARRRWHERYGNGSPGREPERTAEINKAIKEALQEHDRGRLAEAERDDWKRLSPVRAAGIGLFLDPFMTGQDPESQGKLYLEPWRPWKRQRGKPDPVERYAALYFEEKGL